MIEKNTRRQFLKHSAATSAALGAMGAMAFPGNAHAAGSDTIRIGVIGCGGRGTGAVINALNADPNTQLVAMGETFADRAALCLEELKEHEEIAGRLAVDPEHIFIGFDAYKNVIDSDIDVVIHTAPPHFRPMHLKYAVDAGKHSFVEKPIAVDAPGVKSVIQTCAEAKKKNLAIVSGLCWRYDVGIRATMQKIKEGAIGDILSIESSYNTKTLWHRGDNPEWSRMEYQVRNWMYYTWLSGDHIVEQAIHSLDKTAWLQDDASPLRAIGTGGRQQRTDKKYGHIFDHHTVFYEYASGIRVYFTCRQQDGGHMNTDELVIGTKGTAQIIKHRIEGENPWRFRGSKPDLYQVEHEELFKSIRDGNPINNGDYMCNSTMIAIMGRMCTYTGQQITWEQAVNSEERLGPTTYEWGDMPEPDVAIPGVTKFV